MHIHITDTDDNNVRMILPPSSDGAAPIVYTYTVSFLGSAEGMAFDGTHIHLTDRDDNNVRMILPPSSDGAAAIVYTYTVAGLGEPRGMAFDGTHIHLVDRDDDNVRMVLPPSADGAAAIVYTYTVAGLGDAQGIAFDGTHLHIVDRGDDNVRMVLPPSSDGAAAIVYTYTVAGLGDPRGMAFDGTHIHIVDRGDDNVRMILPPSSDGAAAIVYTYTVAGLGEPRGMAFDGGLTTQAVLTITTDDTDIRAGEAVDISIASDIDITGFTASDISVTGGTRGALTGSGMSWTLAVTAGAAGTMTIAIAEDAVSPGNVAVSQNFTVTARATATITFDDASGESGGSTGVNIAFGESVTGLQLSELTASAGTLSSLTGGGTSWEANLTFPATGNGTVTVSLAQDSTSPQNASASASISYAEDLVATTLDRISGNSQTAVVSTALPNPFVVEVQDQNGDVLSGVTVTFAVTGGGGTLSASSVTTGSTGRAESTLTLGSTAGTNTVTATVSGITAITFTATGTAAADPLTLSWTVPTAPVGNTFSATLNSNYPITGVELNDFRFRIEDNSEGRIDLTTANTTLAEVSGTNNWQLDITLTGTLDADYTMRLRGSTVQYDGSDYPSVFLVSDAFAIDSSLDNPDFGSETIDDQAWSVGTAESLTLPEATGGTGTITYSLSPTTPAGVTFTASTRVLAGNPTGRFTNATFTYTATDADGNTDELTFTIVVTASAITFDSGMANQSWTVGTAVSVTTPTLSGGVGAFTYSITPALPAGVTFTAGTRLLSGTPTAVAASATYTYTGTDAEGIAASRTFTIVVAAAALVATTVVHISGNNQIDTVGTTLSTPYVVEVRDQNGDALSGITVAFAVTAGGGSLSASSVTTDSSGQAESTLTLGSTTGTNTVTATASGITAPVTFTATATATGTAVASYIHITDASDDNIRMILPPTSGGAASIVRTYTVDGLNSPIGMAFDGTHLHIVDTDDDNIRMILPPSADGQASVVRTYTVSGLNNAGAMTFDGTHIHLADINDNNVRMILPPSTGGQASVVRTYTVTFLGDPSGMAFDGTHIHLADFTDDNIRMILPPSSGGSASVVYTYTVFGLDNPRGMTFDGTYIHLADINDDNVRMIAPPSSSGQASTVRTYTVSGLGNPSGMTFDGGLITQAVLTLTTTDTDIRAGEAVDIDIASDIDITDFTASDISVTGGTRGALTGSGMSWTLAVTAGAAGTMTIAIAEDAVSPGNTAVSQDFTVTALVTGTITFDDGFGDSGGDTGVNIELSESVTGLALSDFTVVNGTLSNLQGTGTSYTATLNFPASGTNTTTVTLRANTVSPSNAAIVATIIYFQVQTDAVLNITIDQTSVENSEVVNVTFTFDSAVTGFTAGDVVVTFGATKGALTNEGNNVYTMPVTAPSTGSGTIVVSVAEDRVSPGNNTDNVSFTYTTPVVALSFGSTIATQSWTVGTAVSLTLPTATGGTGTITYSLSPTLPAGVTFTASTRSLAGTPTAAFTSATFTYTAEDADGTTLDQTFTIVVAAAVATDAVFTITPEVLTIEAGETADIDITSDVSVNGLTAADISVDSGTLGALTGSGSSYTIPLTAPSSGSGTITITIRVDAVTQGNAETTATVDYAEIEDTIYLHDANSDEFKAFDFDGTAIPSKDVASGYADIDSAFATDEFVYAFDDAANMIRVWDLLLNRRSDKDFAPDNPTHSHRAMAANDRDLILVNDTDETLEFYDLIDDSYDSSLDVGLSSGAWTACTRGGDNLFLGNNISDVISKLSLTGAADSTFTLASIAVHTVLATSNRLHFVHRTTGATLAYDFNGNAQTGDNLALGAGVYEAGFVVFGPTVDPVDAVLNITLSDTSIDGGDSVDATFTFDKGVTNFVAADVTLTGGGSKGTLTDNGDNTFTMPITAPSTGDGTITVSVAADAVDPGNNSDSASFTYTEPTAALSFGSETIANQSWTVSTAITSLTLPEATGGEGTITYSLSPTTPTGTTFTASTRVLAGTPTTAFSSATFTYTAEDADGTTVSLTFTIVVAAATSVPNAPTNLSATAAATSMALSWTAPSDNGGAAITEYQYRFTTGSTAGGTWTDTNSTATSVTISSLTAETEYTFQVRAVNSVGNSPASSAVTESTTAASTTEANDEIHIADNTGNEVGVIAPDTADGQRAVALRIYDLPTVITNPHGIGIDGDGNLHVADTTGDDVAVIAPDTADGAVAVALRTYNLPTGITSPRGLVADGDGNLHVADTSADEVAVIAPDTADGATAVAIRTYDLPTSTSIPSGLTIDGDGNIHVSDSNDDNIRVYAPNVADGQRAVALRTYDLPTGLNNPEGLTTDRDGNIHIVDISDDEVTVIAPDTADGARAVAIRTYGVPTGITAPQGLAFVAGSEDTVVTDALDFGSETIDDQAWSVGTAESLTLPEATGGEGTITYSLSPTTLPDGVTFTASTRVLAGTPTGRFTSATFTYTAEDADGTTVDLTFTIVVTATAITFSPTSFANQSWTVGTAVSLTLPSGAGGVGDLTPTLTPTLPSGVSFTASTRALAGNPTATFTSATFTYTMTDEESESASITFTIVVNAEALVATTVVEISGDDQSSQVSTALDAPFVVEVRDQNGDGLSGATVAFAVTAGGGSLSASSVTTNASGRAESTLTLGSTIGTNTVTATVSGITSISFTATGTAEDLVATTLDRISGNDQTATVSTVLDDPFVVEVQDQNGDVLSGATVTFAVTIGNGTLSDASVTTDSNGRAESTLTLGSAAGSNRAVASVSGITQTRTFNATGTAVVLAATALVEVSGDDQSAVVSSELSNPFVVQVNDQNGDAFSGATVTFAVTSGGGTLSATSVTTGADGRAEATLTLGSTAGTNTVTADVSGISTTITFTATGTAEALVATTLVRLSGNAQTGTVGKALDNPFVAEVQDQNGDALSGVTVTFAVTIGGGSISASSVTTNASGQAETTLTLGTTAGSNRVTANVSGITTTRNFNATGQAAVATTIVEISGDGQAGDAGATLNDPFIVEVRDQDGDALSGVTVAFAVTGGGGSLSDASVTTDASGRAESTLTLGATTTNTVTATASGITTPITFTATVVASLSFGTGTISNQAWEVGTAVSLTLPGAAGVTGTITYALSPTTPPGVNFTASTRKLTGNPTLEFSSATFTYTATAGTKSVTLTFRIVVTDPSITSTPRVYESHSVRVNVVIDGQDMTEYLPARTPLSIGRGRDFPNLGVFNSGGVNIPLQNASGMFDPGNPSNFFVSRSLPANGRGAKVLLRITRDGAEVFNIAGEIAVINQSLASSLVSLVVRDLSLRLRRTSVEDFGQTIVRRITDYEGANTDYDELNPVFYFPDWGLPMSPGSAAVTVHEGSTDVTLNIADTLNTSGVLSNLNAAIDYNRGIIRFEAPPSDGDAAEITASWKIDYRHKRPDTLIRLLLADSDIHTVIGISDSTDARFAIEQALIRHPTDRIFTSHGRPYFEEQGIVRWLKLDEDADSPIVYMCHDSRFIKYDVVQDEYTKIADFPQDSTLQGITNIDIGMLLADESFVFDHIIFNNNETEYEALALGDDQIYLWSGHHELNSTLYDGTFSADQIDFEELRINGSLSTPSPAGMAFYNGELYSVGWSASAAEIANTRDRIAVSNPADGSRIRTIDTGLGSGVSYRDIAVDDERIRILDTGVTDEIWIRVTDHSNTRMASEEFRIDENDTFNTINMDTNDTHLYAADDEGNFKAWTLGGVRDSEKDFYSPNNPITEGSSRERTVRDIEITNTKLYALRSTFHNSRGYNEITVHRLGVNVDLSHFIPWQFDTDDFDTFFFLCSNNAQGNIFTQTTLNKVQVLKYVVSSGTWSTILNEATGQPQLSHPYWLNRFYPVSDNRKHFQVINKNGDDLLFYRRARETVSAISVWNDTAETVTDVYSISHSATDNEGLPYGMDFALDDRSDGIYVYIFQVKHTLDNDGNLNSATINIYRKRVEPDGTQTTIYTEAIAGTSLDEDYPVSISDVILADDRDKWYFVIDYFGEGDRAGKSELCALPKAGGTRTVLKTYNIPTLSVRSPVKLENRYLYLEGGSVRLPRTDRTDFSLPEDERHYPNESGRLIEIESDDTITDHGVVFRSGTKLDSPDPDIDTDQYDGWGLHNSIVSNMAADRRDNLHFIAGFGLPYEIEKNTPRTRNAEPAPDLDNFIWVQWGQDFATKIATFATQDNIAWDLIQKIAQLMNWEIGFGPRKTKVDALQERVTSVSDWSANASVFFRPRTIIPARLRTALAAGTLGSIFLDFIGVPAEILEFPVPPAGEVYKIVIGNEIFSYTSAAVSGQGVELSGISRSVDGSVAGTHAADSDVLFVDAVIRDSASSLIGIDSKSIDVNRIYNSIVIGDADDGYRADDAASIEQNGKRTLRINPSFLNVSSDTWSALLPAEYLRRFKDYRYTMSVRVPYSPSFELGQLVVLKTGRGFVSDYEKFEVMRITDNLQNYQTTLIVRGY